MLLSCFVFIVPIPRVLFAMNRAKRQWVSDSDEEPARAVVRTWDTDSDVEGMELPDEPPDDAVDDSDQSSGDSDNDDADGFPDRAAFEDDDPPPASDPITELIAFCTDLLYSRVLTYRYFCILMWMLAKCGLQECAKYGLHPNAQST